MSKSSIYAIYKRALASNYGPLYHPNWAPTDARELGDFGTLLNGLFTRLGNLSDLDIHPTGSRSAVKAHQTFSAGAGASYDFTTDAKARARKVATAKVTLKVSFSGGQGVSIQAYGLQHTRIQNYQQVAAAVLKLYSRQKWDERWVVVTELYQAERCIMAISMDGHDAAEIEFEARQQVLPAEVSMANVNLDLICKSHRNIGYTLDTQHGKATLGLGFGKVRVPFLRQPRVEPFENRARWGSDGPTTNFETVRSSSAGISTPDSLVAGEPQFVSIEAS